MIKSILIKKGPIVAISNRLKLQPVSPFSNVNTCDAFVEQSSTALKLLDTIEDDGIVIGCDDCQRPGAVVVHESSKWRIGLMGVKSHPNEDLGGIHIGLGVAIVDSPAFVRIRGRDHEVQWVVSCPHLANRFDNSHFIDALAFVDKNFWVILANLDA